MAAALEQANAAALPTARLTSVEAAYWTNVGSKEHLRWVMPEPEDQLLDALARLHAAGKDDIAPRARASSGCSAPTACSRPVWDLPVGTGAEPLEEPAERFAADLARGPGRRVAADRRAAVRALGPRQPSGHHPLTLTTG